MGISHVVYQATGLPSSETLFPTPVEAFFKGFLFVHDKWKWIRLSAIYSDKNKFFHLAAGEGLNQLAGDLLLVRTASLAVLIATRILYCTKEYEKLQESLEKMFHTFDHSFPVAISCDWDQNTCGNFFSVSTVIWIKITAKSTLIRIQKIAVVLFHVGKHTFLLTMRLADAVESFSFTPEVKEEGVRLFFVNISEWVDKLSQNRELLLNGLRSNQDIIEKVLEGVGSSMEANTLIETVESIIDKAEGLNHASEAASRNVIDFFAACCKKWGYEFLKEIGLHHLVPKSMVPSPTLIPSLPDPEDYSERFPPVESITKPKKHVASSSIPPSKRSHVKKTSVPVHIDTSLVAHPTLTIRTTPSLQKRAGGEGVGRGGVGSKKK